MGNMKDKHLSEEEMDIRHQEDQLFDELKAPPTVLKGIMDVLGDKDKTRAIAQTRIDDERRRKQREKRKMKTLKIARQGEVTEESPKPKTTRFEKTTRSEKSTSITTYEV